MNIKKCYAYNPETGEYVGEDILYENPKRSNEFFTKDNVTEVEPPKCGKNEIPVWDGLRWKRKADYRGNIYWSTKDKSRYEMVELGKLPPNDYTEKEPCDPDCVWDFEKIDWVIPFDVQQKRAVARINVDVDRKLAEFKEGYSQSEVESWARQERGANLLKDNPNSNDEDAEFIKLLAASRGIEWWDLVERILDSVEKYRDMSAEEIGEAKRKIDLIWQAATEEELNNIE